MLDVVPLVRMDSTRRHLKQLDLRVSPDRLAECQCATCMAKIMRGQHVKGKPMHPILADEAE
jgi:hypothetical protein